jgi:hypothetical protein
VFAARVLRRSRGFTIIAASSLALAIGANTTIFSIGKQLLFDRLDVLIPYAQQTQVRRLTYMIRTQVAAETIVPALRKVLHAADPHNRSGSNAAARRRSRYFADEDQVREVLLRALTNIDSRQQ